MRRCAVSVDPVRELRVRGKFRQRRTAYLPQ